MTAPHPFGLDALQDQHLGGLLMWMPTHMFLLLALGITFIKWFVDSDRQIEQTFAKVIIRGVDMKEKPEIHLPAPKLLADRIGIFDGVDLHWGCLEFYCQHCRRDRIAGFDRGLDVGKPSDEQEEHHE